MPVERKLDPFKPQEPAIPGVPAASEKREKPAPKPLAPPPATLAIEPTRAEDSGAKWIGIGVGIVAIVLAGGVFLYWGQSAPVKSPPANNPIASTASLGPVEKAAPERLLIGPGPVATTADLARPWSAKKFLFRDSLTPGVVPAMVVRLPGGELWGFSLREPFGACELEYVTDLETLETHYGFRAEHPMVVNPCTRAVYDLLRYGGGAPNGGLVRGDIVQGAGVRPPMAIEMSTKGKEILAVRGE